MNYKRLLVVALGAGAVAVVAVRRRAKAGGIEAPDVAGGGPTTNGPLRIVEVETKDVDDHGNVVVDDLVVAVDDDGTIVASDETVAVISPEGDVVVDETLSVVGEDGKLHAVEEDIAVLDADRE